MPYLLMHVLEITFTLNINLYYRRKHIMTAKETNSLMNCKDYVIYRLDYTLGNFIQIWSHMLPLRESHSSELYSCLDFININEER